MLNPGQNFLVPPRTARCAPRRTLLAVGVALALGVSLGSPVAAATTTTAAPAKAPVSDANSVLAAYLVNFLRYVEWPEPVPPVGEPWRIGLLNTEVLRPVLERMVEGKMVRGRTIKVVHAADIAALRDCQLVLLGESAPAKNETAAQACAGRPVLTVVYHEREAANKAVVIELVLRDRKIRYRLNAGLLAAQGLKPTPGLLENALPPATPDVAPSP